MRVLIGAAAVTCLGLCSAAYGQSSAPASTPAVLRIPRVSRPPSLQDFLSGTPRDDEFQVSDFRQNAPGDGIPATRHTTAYLSYDDQHLYVVFVCKDDPAKIRARLSRREDIDGDDNVGVDLDTFNDHQRFYMFLVNPRGVQMDAIVTEGQGTDASFDTLWYSDARLTDDGFVVWMAIPFRSLRFPNTGTQKWGIALGRLIKRNSEFSFWPYITQRIETTAGQFATLEGLEGIAPGRNLQFIPYGVSTRSRFLDPLSTSSFELRSSTEARAGLDAKVVVRDAMTFDIALNPDFSQVESDEPQVTVNQRFEVFFPEKRPFFIENAGFFETPIKLFFSRRIADPQLGARMTGKAGSWAVGLLAADDRAPGEQLPDADPFHDRHAGIGVVRAQREFASQSRIGALFTSWDFAETWNRVFSLDTRLKLGPNWVMSAQAARSDTQPFGSARAGGHAYWTELSYTGRHASYATRYSEFSPDFQSQLGFVPRVDIRKAEQYARYYWKPQKGPVQSFGPDVTASLTWDHHGRVQDRLIDASFGADLRGPTGVGCRYAQAYELFASTEFRHHYTECGVTTKRVQALELLADYGWGTGINYFPTPGVAPFLANSSSLALGATLRPTRRISFAQTCIVSRLRTIADVSSPRRIFDDHLARSKLNLQFTRALSFRGIIDYHSVLRDPSLVSLAGTCATCSPYISTKRVNGDVLLTYLLNPGTAAYVGFTTRRENPLDSSLPLEAQPRDSRMLVTGRLLFVKISYLFRY